MRSIKNLPTTIFDMRLVLVCATLSIATVACSLGGSIAPTPLPTADTSPVAVNPTLVPSPTTDANIVPSLASGNPSDCTTRTDWPTYLVQAGDTLTAIAQRTYISLTDLATANCLSQTTKVVVGQAIYVPRAPLAAVPVANGGGPAVGLLTIQPSSDSKNGSTDREALAGSPVSLQVSGVQNGNLVTFYAVQQGNPEHVVGTAAPVSGVATLSWQIPANVGQDFFLRAEAVGSGGQSASTIFVRVLIGTSDAGPSSQPNLVGCPSSPPPRLTIGGMGRVTPGLPNTLRSLPGKSSSGSVVTGQMSAGSIFTVLAGPQCADAYIWWQVNYNGKIGWTPEGENTTYWLEPITSSAVATVSDGCPTTLPPRLVVGGQGRVTPGLPNAIRTSPSKSTGTAIGQIPAGAVFNIIGGPACGDGLRFWQVTYNGKTGWTAEGQGVNYWLEPIQ